MLKEQLTAIRNMDSEQLNEFRNQDKDELIKQMLGNIGSTDAELRDALIYSTFFKLIMEDFLTTDQLAFLLEVCLDSNHLFLEIGSKNDDSVFTRSFSSLVIALVLFKDKSGMFLSTETLEQVFNRINLYLKKEEDTRGYVEGKGWAHSIAHGADLLASAINHPFYSVDRANEFLATLHKCLFKDGYYINEEDERLIFIIEALNAKGLEEGELEEWVLSVFKELEAYHETNGYSLDFFRIKTNILNFAKTLYFRLEFDENNMAARGEIKENISKWHKKVYAHYI